MGSSIKPFEIAQDWTTKLYDEFFTQGDKEKDLGLNVSFLCDRQTTNIASSQFGFISNMVMPTYSILSNLCPDICNV
jgi:hypothetical protein